MSDTKTPPSADAATPAVPPDPIYQKSYSVHIAVASVLLVGSVAYAVAQEAWLLRPYKPIQAQWKEATLAWLDQVEKERVDFDQALRLLDEFKALDKAAADVDESTKAERDRLGAEFADLESEVNALKDAIKTERSEIAALTYDAEHAAHEAVDAGDTTETDPLKSEASAAIVQKIADVKARTITYEWTRRDGERVKESKPAGDLIERFVALQGAKGRKQQEVGAAFAPKSAAEKKRDDWVARNLKSIKMFFQAPRVTERDEEGNVSATAAPDKLVQQVAAKVAEVGVSRYLDDYAVTLPPATVAKVRSQLEKFPTDPLLGGEIQKYQIHVKDTANWVDRCEVCHLGARSVLPVTADALRGAAAAANWPKSKIEGTPFPLFASHPRSAELFAKHDPDKMGCSTCHNGNGIAIISTELAHGENHHWDWPLFAKENVEAGCLQCHQQDVHLEGGPRISAARETFMDKGCWGCHKYEGYDKELDEITKLEGRIKELERDREAKETRKAQLQELVLPLEGDELIDREGSRAKSEGEALQEKISQVEAQTDAARERLAAVQAERVRVGPNLKDVKVKWRPEALTAWVQDPHLVKHDPKMPRFRWVGAADEHGYTQEAKDVAAFLVQNSLDPNEFPEYAALAQAPAGGSAGRGKELFEKKGCLACHAVNGAEGKRTGGTFASNLTDVGDKLTYEYAYRWIRAPRHRIVPWSVRLKKDLTEAEAKAEDPRTLVRRQPTRMPDLRLSDEEARDVASYLVSLKSGKSYPAAPWLADTSKDANGKTAFDRGRDLVVYSGCAGCHEIRGLESERGIGTELTKEGSKPLDRLDFGHLTTAAKRGHEPLADWASADGVKIFAPEEGHGDGGHHGWYRPRGFFMHKLAKPDLFDTSKYFADRFLRARMPQFDLKAQEIHDLTTFLLGSVETRIPEGSRYRPDETGQAIRDGWWIVKRYNCEGCHPVEPGNVPSFRTLPWWTTDTIGDMNFPPTLVGAGFRIRPDWMAKFLHDPSMGGGTDRPTALRRHLEVRMPSFSFTEEEVAKLVRFFDAMSKQPFVYQPPAVAALSDKEKRLAEKIWSKDGMNCMQCHLSSGPDGKEKPDSETKAPHFGYAKERLKPEWMRRWIPNPPAMQPTTKMTNDFLREKPDDPHSRWIYKTVFPEGDGVTADHVDLMIRYLFTLPEAK